MYDDYGGYDYYDRDDIDDDYNNACNRKPKQPRRTKRVEVVFSPDEYRWAKDAAVRAGLPLAAYIRSCVINRSLII